MMATSTKMAATKSSAVEYVELIMATSFFRSERSEPRRSVPPAPDLGGGICHNLGQKIGGALAKGARRRERPSHCKPVEPTFVAWPSNLKHRLTENSRMRRIAQATGWILLFAIVVVSFAPPELRPETNLPNDLEHAAIFFLAGCAFGVGYANGFLGWLYSGLIGTTAVIEIVQLAIPGRHARLLDFVVDAVSIAIGLAIGARLARIWQ
jgi:VanZ family protein